MRKKIVFILGMHRSGTSLTAELVNSMGFAVPGTNLDQMDSVNAHGFWESREVVDINERILAAAQLKWYHICPVGHLFQNLPDASIFAAEISRFLLDESRKHGDLVIKDPRLCILWPLWFSNIDHDVFDVKVIFLNRHPSSIAASIKIRDGFSILSTRLLCLYYIFSVFSAKNFPPVLVLDYDLLVRSADRAVALSEFIGSPEVSDSDWRRVVDPELCRNYPVPEPFDTAVYNLDKEVFSVFSHGAIYQNFDFISEQSRKFEKFIFESSELIYALNESNNSIVDARTDLVEMGEMHSEALRVIGEKDFSLFENAAYIDNCHSRISDLDLLVSRLGALPNKVSDLENRLAFCNEEMSKSSAYIAECEGRILNLEFSLSGFSSLRAQFDKVSAVLRSKEQDAENNAKYIDSLHNRISELEESLLEFNSLRARISEIEQELNNKEIDAERNVHYIEKCHARIRELDEVFAQQRSNYLSALNAISQLESRLSLRNDEFLSVVDELDSLRRRLSVLLRWKVVRIINNRIHDSGAKND